jgi:hypothetical protein
MLHGLGAPAELQGDVVNGYACVKQPHGGRRHAIGVTINTCLEIPIPEIMIWIGMSQAYGLAHHSNELRRTQITVPNRLRLVGNPVDNANRFVCRDTKQRCPQKNR